ncbi:hypothetical protein OHC33_011162 [Knufia fluminis]|uniref:6-phosphogluconolactonase n=1 Tax=Knufia fluminis TaxID=191047 RepID=A0AAN8EIF1_9EURO|nr:hypothetical protein OHC33_011162 [Knufia fluminis]
MTQYLRMVLTLLTGFAVARLDVADDTTVLRSAAHVHSRDGVSLTAKSTPADLGSHKLLVGSAGQLRGIDFDGTVFTPRENALVEESGKAASWMIFKEPNLLYAVDENSDQVRLFAYDPEVGALTGEPRPFTGTPGAVHLALTQDQKRLIASSYGKGAVDIWDSSAADGTLQLIKTIMLVGAPGPDTAVQTQLRAHQGVADPTGRFVVVNDLGGDMIHVLDAAADSYSISNVVKTDPGCGPRHGGFLQLDGGAQATHYVVVCEISNMVQLFSVSYGDTTAGLTYKHVHAVSTFGAAFPPVNATSARAGELLIAKSGAIYVSNRLTGNQTDSISHFALEAKSNDDTTPQLVFKSGVSSGGVGPRMMSWSHDEEVMFVANMNGVNGLVALKKDSTTGVLDGVPLGVLTNEAFAPDLPVGQGFGPMFVQEVA